MTDAITPDEALAIFRKAQAGKAERIATLEAEGYKCCTTSAGWLGYPNEKLTRLATEAVEAGFTHIKMKVGRDLDDDIRRLEIVRSIMGPDRYLMIDANQVWDVGQAIDWVRSLSRFNPYFIEEPTSPDDVLGHKAIRDAIAPGEGGDRRDVPKPHPVQAVHHLGRHRHRPDRRLPHRRPQRGAVGAAAGHQVRPAGLAACRRRRPLRVRRSTCR